MDAVLTLSQMLGGWLNWKGTQTPHAQFYNNVLRSTKKPGLRLKCYLSLPGHLNTCSASGTPTKAPWSRDKAQHWAPSYTAPWTGQYKAPLLIYNTGTRWWHWKMITAKQRDTFTAGRYRTPLRNVRDIAELKIQIYLSLNAIISYSLQNLTFTFLMVHLSFGFTFCIVTIPLLKVFGKLQYYDIDSFLLQWNFKISSKYTHT